MTDQTGRLPRIEAMRGVAALSVFAFHCFVVWDDRVITNPQATWRQIALTLDVGVTIFFVISGFLLFGPFARALIADRHLPDVRAYAWRRFLRIVPAYWFALIVLMIFTQRPDPMPEGPLPYFLFVQNYSWDTAGRAIGQAWTLSIEVTFYALLPILSAAVALVGRHRRRALWVALATLVLASVAWKIALTQASRDGLLFYSQWLPWHLDVFVVGMVLAILVARGARPLPRIAVPALLVLAATALVTAGLSTEVSQKEWWALNLRQSLYTVAAGSVMAVAVLAPPGRVDRVLQWRPLVLAGVLSYSIYLFHLGIITRVYPRVSEHVDGPLEGPLKMIAALAVTLVVSAVVYRLVERPALRLKRLVPDRRPRGAPPVSPAADVPAP